ncbi:MAG: hypothetical protein JWL64_90 [Frankiales bacterium]|nr:hypothetical protein [Frankiales bacterium]
MTKDDGGPARPSGRVVGAVQYVVVLWLTALVGVWGAVLTMLRLGGTPVPVGLLLVAALGPCCWWGGDLKRSRWGAAGPAILWAVLVLPMMSQRREGDLIVTGSLRGIAYLAVGALACATATGSWQPRATPAAPTRRDTSHGGVVAR